MTFAETIDYRMNEIIETIIKKKTFWNVAKKIFEIIATIFNMIMTIIFFMNEKEIFETVEIIDRFMINVPQDFVRLTSWNSIQTLLSLRSLFENFFK